MNQHIHICKEEFIIMGERGLGQVTVTSVIPSLGSQQINVQRLPLLSAGLLCSKGHNHPVNV